MRALAISATVLMLAGCASSMDVYGPDGARLPGIPVSTPVTFVESGVYTKLLRGGACERAPYQTYVTEPIGRTVYVNVKPAQLAKTALDVKFAANGGLQEVTLNTEPSSGDILKNAADAIKTLAPLAALAPMAVASSGFASDAPPPRPPCDTAPDPAQTRRTPLDAALTGAR